MNEIDREDAYYLITLKLNTMMVELNLANDLFSSNKGQKDARFAVRVALNAIIDFLESVKDPKRGELPRPLLELVAALHEVDKGHAHPLFTPERAGHRPRARPRDGFLKGYAAAVMELLMRADAPKEVASARVAQAMTEAGFRMPGPKQVAPGANTVAAWRDQVTGYADESDMADAYRTILQRLDRLHQLETNKSAAERIAENALVALKNFVRDWNLEKPPA